MDNVLQSIGTAIGKMTDLRIAVETYIQTINQYQEPILNSDVHKVIVIPENIVQILGDLFSKTNFDFPIKLETAREKFSYISLFSVFGALRHINVLILTTRVNMEGELLANYLDWNPFVSRKPISASHFLCKLRFFPLSFYFSKNTSELRWLKCFTKENPKHEKTSTKLRI
jgi:hypothetical protein